jgi:hypothetical protein
MSEQRLKDLLEELAADVPYPDGQDIDAAWQAARRRTRRVSVLAAASAAVALIVGTTVVFGTRTGDDSLPPGNGTPSPASSAPERTEPDAMYGGVPVWWAPPAAAETRLQWIDSKLPKTVDVGPGQPLVEPGESALGLFAVNDLEAGRPVRFIVLTATGDTRELPARHIEGNRDQGGNAGALMPFNGGLSPTGRHVFLAQQSSIELYDFASGTWTTIDTPDWLAEHARWLDAKTIWVPNGPDSDVGSTYGIDGRLLDPEVRHSESDIQLTAADQPYGIWVDAPSALAGTYFLHGPVKGGPYGNPEGVVARVGNKTSILALSVDGRGKGCCPVVGWLGDDMLGFESGGRVLAWKVATGAVYRVTDVVGLKRGTEAVASSWAWQALR